MTGAFWKRLCLKDGLLEKGGVASRRELTLLRDAATPWDYSRAKNRAMEALKPILRM
jgi:hypothetical protein